MPPEASAKQPQPEGRKQLLLLFGLTNLGIAQPLYQTLGARADFFVAHKAEPLDMLVMVVALSVGPALLLFLATRLVTLLHPASGAWLWRASLAGCLLLVVLTVLLNLLGPASALPAILLVVAATSLSLGGAWLIERSIAARSFAYILSVGAICVPLVFLIQPGVRAALTAPPAPSSPANPIDSEVSVVLIVFDELPVSSLQKADRSLDSARFPNFAELAQTSSWYRRANTVAESTVDAAPAILTGLRPREPALANLAAHPNNLFTWLGASYRVNARQNYTRLCPDQICESEPSLLLHQRLELLAEDLAILYGHLISPHAWRDRLPDVDQTWAGFRSRTLEDALPADSKDIPAFLESFIADIEGSEPALHYFHPNLPHVPWRYLPSGKQYGPIGDYRALGLEGERWRENEWLTLQAYQRHLLQVAYADRVLGRIVGALRSQRSFDEALVIVTADHGASFFPGEHRRTAEERRIEDVLEVPLLVKLPGQKVGSILDRPVELVDIVPTIAEVLGAREPWRTDGVSLLQNARRRAAYTTRHDGKFSIQPIHTDDGRRQATLDRKLRFFGEGDISGVYDIGRTELLGRKVRRNNRANQDVVAWRARIHDQWTFENVATSSDYLPARVFGTLIPASRQKVPAPVELAISVNGEIAATTFPTERSGKTVFSAMVPPDSLVDGSNSIDVYAINGPPGRTSLSLLGGQSDRARLLTHSGRLASIESASGRSATIAFGQVKGTFEVEGPRVFGEAYDNVDLVPLERLHVFVGSLCVFSGAPERRPTPHLSQEHSAPRLERAGFEVWLPRTLLTEVLTEGVEVRVFGQIGEVASELNTTWRQPSLDAGSRIRFRLIDNARLVGSGAPIAISDDATTGELDMLVRVGRRGMRLGGWALDRKTLEPAQQIVVLVGSEADHSSVVRSVRRNLVPRFGEEARSAGFLFDLPRGLLRAEPPVEIRVFAVAEGGAATELLPGGNDVAELRSQLGAR